MIREPIAVQQRVEACDGYKLKKEGQTFTGAEIFFCQTSRQPIAINLLWGFHHLSALFAGAKVLGGIEIIHHHRKVFNDIFHMQFFFM